MVRQEIEGKVRLTDSVKTLVDGQALTRLTCRLDLYDYSQLYAY